MTEERRHHLIVRTKIEFLQVLNETNLWIFLIECLDKNLLYVPIADIDSNEYSLSEEDVRLSKEFYKMA